jgi:tetratricopeptide (TPR) repeat protein
MIRTTAIATFLALAATSLCAQQEPREGSPRIAARSQEALSRDEPGRALDLVEQGLRNFPDDESLQVQLARVYVYQKHDPQAIEVLKRILLKNPASRAAKLELAQIFGYRANYQPSDRLYRELLAADANDETASLGLVHNLILERKKAEARREVEQALARHPTSLELQKYSDYLASNPETEVSKQRLNRIQATESFFEDTSANRSFYSSQTLTDELSKNSSSRFRVEETSLWKSGGPKAGVLSGSEELRYKINDFVAARAGAGAVRFSDSGSHLLYSGDLDLHPEKNLFLSGGFSRFPISPTFDSAQFDLLSEGWHGRAEYSTRDFSLSATVSFPHYSAGNHSQREAVEALRWFGPRDGRFAVAGGYAFRHLHFSHDLNHGYFSPAQYYSQLGAAGFRLGIGKIYRGEYLGYAGGELLGNFGNYTPAGELLLKNAFAFGRWGLAVDYSYFHVIQATGAFRANAASATLGYKF